MVKGCYPHAQPPSWRTIPYCLSAAAYSIYSQLTSIAGGRSSIHNPRTLHAVIIIIIIIIIIVMHSFVELNSHEK
jgi:hypothetical protein